MTPLLQAEQAVLGAVLLEPRQLGHLAGWLRPEHFYRPAHAALYGAMLDLHASGHPATTAPADVPVPLTWVNDTRDKASEHTRGVTAAYVHSLPSACPRPAHAPVYGRMVLEGAIHRSVTQHAVRLHHAARGAGVEETLHHAQVLADVLTELARRWGTEPRPAPPGTPSPASAPAPGRAKEQVLAEEEFLLGMLTTQPQQLGEVVHWLRPEDFADPGHRQIYGALGALHHRGEPVDQLTVLWECQRRGVFADGTLEPDRVRRLCDTTAGGSAGHFGEQVLDASLLRTAAASARQIRDLAENDALAAGQLISQAFSALTPLDQARRRRATAIGGPEPDKAPKSSPAPPPTHAAAARARSPALRTETKTPPSTTTPPSTSPLQLLRRGPS
ncbi:DnaB-like helicase N-terminal domain-containing protein [Streptomyces yatensis]|uniref:DnaB-like helicase N-terminal domain-containing protein n=1 Tax=Streptomyces yatensis TaxID=155177 RepID=A0ABP4UMT7_9ACTN|nr:DnaB-like helicase N-terminal domain-containing protein [Streptomyces yatensis]